jgi:DNA-binding XRE family transcriptional regulator
MRARANPTPTRVRQLREERGIIREQLAVKAGVASSTLYLVERAGLMSDATAAKIAAALGVPVEELRS